MLKLKNSKFTPVVIFFLSLFSWSAVADQKYFYNLKGENFIAKIFINEHLFKRIELAGRGNAQGDLKVALVQGVNTISMQVRRTNSTLPSEAILDVIEIKPNSQKTLLSLSSVTALTTDFHSVGVSSFSVEKSKSVQTYARKSISTLSDEDSSQIILLAKRYITAYKKHDVDTIMELDRYKLQAIASAEQMDYEELEAQVRYFLKSTLEENIAFDNKALDQLNINRQVDGETFLITRSDDRDLVIMGPNEDQLSVEVKVAKIKIKSEYQWQIVY